MVNRAKGDITEHGGTPVSVAKHLSPTSKHFLFPNILLLSFSYVKMSLLLKKFSFFSLSAEIYFTSPTVLTLTEFL